MTAAMIGSAGCGTNRGTETDEPLGTSQSAVGNGIEDTDNRFPYVGRFSINGSCSAVLITPAWVMTANHCITGACDGALGGCVYNDSVREDVDVQFGRNMNGPLDATGSHTYLASPLTHPNGTVYRNEIEVRFDGPVDLQWFPADGASQDIALIRLDERIPTSVIQPLRPPLGDHPRCNLSVNTDGFVATPVGFGSVGSAFFNGDPVSYRSYNPSSGWERRWKTGDDHLYRNRWLLVIDSYSGILPGDSGGPLVANAGGQDLLCGINSRYYPTLETVPYPPFLVDFWVSEHSAVDSPANIDFMRRSHVIDEDGRLMGECLPGEGPEHLMDVDSDGDLLPDACDPCSHVADQYYRFTGRISRHNPATGEFPEWQDTDKDGVPDVCDNCPDASNAYNSQRQQRDKDGDGLGDACDACSESPGIAELRCCNTQNDCPKNAKWPNQCFPVLHPAGHGASCLAGGFTGRCARTGDFDGDGLGDNCDNCPDDPTFNQDQTDTDNDGVGDVCDSCPGRHPYGPQTMDEAPTCVFDPLSDIDDQDCVSKTHDPTSRCTYLSACTGGADSDGDGIGDACDGCPQTVNKYGNSSFPNCNVETEILYGSYPYKTDECDPNPCTYAQFRAPASTWTGPAQDQEIIWNLVDYRAYTLPNNHPDAYKYRKPQGTLESFEAPTATTGGRFCYCDLPLPWLEMNAMNCNLYGGCSIDSTWYNDPSHPQNRWEVTKMMQLANATAVPPSYVPFPLFPMLPGGEVTGTPMHNPSNSYPAWELGDGSTPSAFLAWNISALNTQTFPHGPNGGFDGIGVEGVLWTHVRQVDGISHDQFRPWSNHYEAGFFGKPPVDFIGSEKVPPFSCGPLCDLNCDICGLLDEVANLILSRINPVDTRVLAVTRHGFRDLTNAMSAPVLEALAQPDAQWITPAETGRWHPAGSPIFALTTPDSTAVSMVAVFAGGSVVPMRRDDSDIPFAMAMSGESTARESAATVLSTTENTLFVIGGKVPGGSWADTLRVYHIPTSAWVDVPVSGVTPRKVLAATYHPKHRSLYVMDEVKIGAASFARLIRLDLRTRQGEALGQWPRHPHFDRLHMTLAWDGSLLVASSSSTKRRHSVLSLELGDGSQPSVVWGKLRKGAIALPPTYTDQAVTLPMVTTDGVVNDVVRREELATWPAPGIAACL